MNTRYCLITDGDGHWAICPADKREEADRHHEALAKYWDDMPDGDPPQDPEWLKGINGPHTITFENPEDPML